MANKEKVLISDLYYSTEKNMPVVGGALYQGYKEMVSGNKERGRKIIVDFLIKNNLNSLFKLYNF